MQEKKTKQSCPTLALKPGGSVCVGVVRRGTKGGKKSKGKKRGGASRLRHLKCS